MEENKIMQEVASYILEELQADGFHRGEDFHGMTVYVPDYKQEFFGGYPLVVFVEKEGKVRLSTPQESIDYLSAITPPTEDEL